jgi:two-component sensor histidine kinase/CheY-like chemotaxis protein
MTEFQRHQISVLFVEDNESIRNLYIKWLEKRVVEVHYATNGQEGMELFTEFQPDLLISDISMPLVNGLDMIRKIKQANPGLYVIIMSAYSFKEYFLEAISLGVNGYLIKPVEPDKLYAMVDELAGYILMHRALEEKEKRRQIAESNLKKSLEEKEVLLKEVHHRVKNNMQIISSILKMQERLIDDPKLKSVLGESQNRIRSMALIHENLYRNESLANIQFKNYAQSLINTISRSYFDQQGKVTFHFNIDDVFLPIDVGIPCGLIINELISNAFKHAFPDRENGNININLEHTGNGAYVLSVSDDGIGIDPSFDPESANSLGMKIVFKLIQQIEGELTYDFSSGTKYLIKFNL